jgi:hypothetical protein
MRLTPAGRGDPCKFFPEKEGKAGDLPAFRLARWPAGRIAKLPAPASAFGLCLRSTKIQDAGPKELAGLTNLQALDLSDTAVTGPGLKALAGLKRLRTLALRGTPVTDAGLKELAGLESLQELDLTDSRVKGAAPGLRELAGLKQLRTLWISQKQLGQSLFESPSRAFWQELICLQQLTALVVRTDMDFVRARHMARGNEADDPLAMDFNEQSWRPRIPRCSIIYYE